GGRKPECGRQQRFGDAWRDDREVGGMRLRDADEAVHDAPDGTEQADEGGGCTNGGKHAGAAQDPPPVACFDARSRRDAIRSLMPSGSVEPDETFNSVTAASRNCMTSARESASRSTPSAVERAWTSSLSAVRTRRLAKKISMVLASHTVQVTIEAKARPIKTAF